MNNIYANVLLSNVVHILLLDIEAQDTKLKPPEPHHLGGARAVTRCGSGFDGTAFKLDVKHRWIIEKVPNSKSFLLFLLTFTTI
jgi:hypothetical protein